VSSLKNPPSADRPAKPAKRFTWSRISGLGRDFAFVTFITLLIWIWADLERTKKEDVTVTVKVVSPQGGALRVIRPGTKGIPVQFVARGSQARLDEFRRRLREDQDSGKEVACVVQANADQTGPYALDTLDVLNKWDRLREAGLSAEDPVKAAIDVEVDRWEQVEAAVRLRTTDDDALEGKPALTPKTVALLVPSSELAKLGPEPVIDTVEQSLEGLDPGQDIVRTVQLAPTIGGVEVRPANPAPVTATFRVKERTKSDQLVVSVRIEMAPEIWDLIVKDGWTLKRDPARMDAWQLQLTIKGPRLAVEKVTAQPDGVHAFVEVKRSDLEPVATYPQHPVTVILPPGVQMVAPTNPSVAFRFERPTPP
jgi:hypothetical protein